MSRQNNQAALTSTHKLLTESWTRDVASFEAAIGQFTADRQLTNDCHVAFFEIAGDRDLHVNVTHQFRTKTMPGWNGPGRLPDGFVSNRRFGDGLPKKILGQIRDMVFAETA